jgi:hypothetical protein
MNLLANTQFPEYKRAIEKNRNIKHDIGQILGFETSSERKNYNIIIFVGIMIAMCNINSHILPEVLTKNYLAVYNVDLENAKIHLEALRSKNIVTKSASNSNYVWTVEGTNILLKIESILNSLIIA